MPIKITPNSETNSRPESQGNKVKPTPGVHFANNFATKEVIYNPQKESELSSEGLEMLDM